MNKSYHALMTLCCLVSFHANAKFSNGNQSKLSIKPSISLGINKRTMTGSISHSTYTGDIDTAITKSGNTNAGVTDIIDTVDSNEIVQNYNLQTLTKNFIKNPFASPDTANTFTPSSTTTGDTIAGHAYKGPGRVYIETNTSTNNTSWTLKKAGTNDNASTTDATPGSNLLFLSNTTTGSYYLPVANLGQPDDGATKFDIYKIPQDGLTSTFDSDDQYTSVRADDALSTIASIVDFEKNTSDIYTLKINFQPNALDPKKYASPGNVVAGGDSDSYYIILAGHNSTAGDKLPANSTSLGSLADNNYYQLLSGSNGAITDGTNVAGSLAYTQDEIEQINYLGMNLGVNASYNMTDFFHVTVALGASSPVEKIEHTGRHLHINPEITLSGKAGLLIGNQNGSIGMLFGIHHDRYTSVVKKFTQSGTTVADITHNLTNHRYTLKENYAVSSIVANIRLTEQVDAFFSTTISEKDLTTTDIKVLTNPKPTNVSYDFGLNLNLDEA